MTWPGVVLSAKGGDNLPYKWAPTNGFLHNNTCNSSPWRIHAYQSTECGFLFFFFALSSGGCYVINKAFAFFSVHTLKGMCDHQVLISRPRPFILHVLLHVVQKKKLTGSQNRRETCFCPKLIHLWAIGRVTSLPENAPKEHKDRHEFKDAQLQLRCQAKTPARCHRSSTWPTVSRPGIAGLKSSRLQTEMETILLKL